MITFQTDIHQLRTEGILSVRATNACKSAKLFTVGDIITAPDRALAGISNCGRKTIDELVAFRSAYAHLIANSDKPGVPPEMVSIFPSELEIMEKKLEYLDIHVKHELYDWLHEQFYALSVRARNAFPSYRELNNVLKAIYGNHRINLMNVKNVGKKTVSEVSAYLDSVKKMVEALTANVDVANPMPANNAREIAAAEFKRKYSFLSDYEALAAAEFAERNREFPTLFVILRYVERTDGHRLRVCRDFYGFNPEGRRFSKEELAKKYSIGTERVRQIKDYAIALPDDLQKYVNDSLAPRIDAVVAQDDPLWESIRCEQEMPIDARKIFMLACMLIATHTPVKVHDDDIEYLVRRDLLTNLKLRTVLTDILHSANLRRTDPDSIDIMSFINKSGHAVSPEANLLIPIYASFLNRVEGYEIVNGQYAVIPPNALNVPRAIEKILQDEHRPLSFNELLGEFNRRHPDYAYHKHSKFRAHIFRSQRIKARGKSGVYVLADWDDQFTGTITDFIYQRIEEAGHPLPLDMLVEGALKWFPNSNTKSIQSIISLDGGKRFVEFDGALIGIAGSDYGDLKLMERRIIKRLPYETRFADFVKFVNDFQRLPACRDSEDEQSLFRWMQNVTHGNIDATQEQLNALNDFLLANKHLPQNGTECHFKKMCDSVAQIVRSTGQKPSRNLHPSEYNWFRKYASNYALLNDNRRRFFEELLEEIDSVLKNQQIPIF